MIYIGLDLSTTSTGLGILDDEKLIHYECIKPKSTMKDWQDRLFIISRRLNELFKEYDIEEAYVEDVPLKDGKPTIMKLSCVRGCAISSCALYNTILIPRKVSDWRQDAGFFDGTQKGMTRDEMKKKAIEEVKRIFGIDVNDDIAESSLIAYRSIYPIKLKKERGM